jgi:putative ABC transport system permease protein
LQFLCAFALINAVPKSIPAPMIFQLATKSLRNRLLTTLLTVVSIAFSVALLVGVENVRAGMRESFSNTISRTDLIVGSRGGTIQLLLYSVFGLGSPTNNISYATYQQLREHPAVAWTIPYSLGDSHRGFRVIGTTDDFYRHYRFRGDREIRFAAGRPAATPHEVVLGSEVARRLGYVLGQKIELSHGIGATSFLRHDDHPFEIVGVLAETFTPVDRALYVTLEGIEAIHEGWQDGAPPMGAGFGAPTDFSAGLPDAGSTADAGAHGHAHDHAHSHPHAAAATTGAVDEPHAHEIGQITSFFVGTKSRMDALRLQREINTAEAEPLMAVLPGVALAEMWRTVGYAEDGLKVVSGFVVVVGLLGMLVALYTSLNARRREMAILRAVGAGPRKIVSLLVLESGLLATAGAALGVAIVYSLLFLLQGPVEARFGLFLPIRALGTTEYVYLGLVVVAGFLIGLVPAIKAYRNTLSDGLSVRL